MRKIDLNISISTNRSETMAAKLDVNKQNIMHAINWITKNKEEIIFESQSQLSFFSCEDLEK